MKKILFIAILMLISTFAFAQRKKDGSPDMRYKANKETYGTSTPSYNYNQNNNVRYQQSYTKQNGTVVQGHYKQTPNKTNHDNYSTRPNQNPYTNTQGSKAKDYSNDAYNYGKGKTIQTGNNGGQYYLNNKGNKTYVPKRN